MVKENPKIRIVCCGNPYRGDDGAGYGICKMLKKEKFPDHIEIIDGGIQGLNLLPVLDGCDTLILVDSVMTDKAPGHVQWFSAESIIAQASPAFSGHEMNPAQLFSLWAGLNGKAALSKVSFLGIVIPPPAGLSGKVSPAVEKGMNTAFKCILEKIRSIDK